MNTLKFKTRKVEGNNEFNSIENSNIYNKIINEYWNKKAEIRKIIEKEIGIKSDKQFEEGSLFAEMFICYSNENEIENKVNEKLAEIGYIRTVNSNVLKYETPANILTEKTGKDIGGSICVVNICDVEIIIK